MVANREAVETRPFRRPGLTEYGGQVLSAS